MKSCYLYIITCGTYVKIGISSKPEKRLKQISTYCPIEPKMFAKYGPVSQAKAAAMERYFHAAFIEKKSYKEWFSFDFFDLQELNAIASNYIDQPVEHWHYVLAMTNKYINRVDKDKDYIRYLNLQEFGENNG